MGAAVLGNLLLPLAGLPGTVRLGAIALGPGGVAAWLLWRDPETTSRIIPAQALTLAAFLLMSLGSGIGTRMAEREALAAIEP